MNSQRLENARELLKIAWAAAKYEDESGKNVDVGPMLQEANNFYRAVHESVFGENAWLRELQHISNMSEEEYQQYCNELMPGIFQL